MSERGAYEQAVEFVLRLEGGYSNSPSDPGGETQFGISKRQYPDLDIRALTKAQAKNIYWRDYWTPYRCGEIEYPPLACHYFSTIVNVGPDDAGRYLQQAANALSAKLRVDGVVGSRTVGAVNQTNDQGLLLNAFLTNVVDHHLERNQVRFVKGLVRRAVSPPLELVA